MNDLKVNLEYHKGNLCPVKYQVCQEGYCSECHVYRNEVKIMRNIIIKPAQGYVSSRGVLTPA
jgi:hypothetical protein